MIIQLKNAVKKYGEGEAVVYALNDINLELEKEEICVVLGPSGSGKSTLLNVLGGLDKVDSGQVIVDGKEISALKPKELVEYRRNDIGFIFQFYNLIADLTAVENIEVVADISKKPMSIDDLLEALEIKQCKHRFPKELSGGQQQRVAIARALVKNPKLLLCDELTGALDSKSSKEVLKYIKKVNEQFHTTVVIITHNENISRMADRIIKIKDGKIVENTINKMKVDVETLEV